MVGFLPRLSASWKAWIRWGRTATITDIVRCIRSSTRWEASTTWSRRSWTSAMAFSKLSWPPAGLIASSAAASSRLFLSGKTRKIVPSAMPAACAISRVLTSPPFSTMRGTNAATIASRRSSADIAVARGVIRQV